MTKLSYRELVRAAFTYRLGHAMFHTALASAVVGPVGMSMILTCVTFANPISALATGFLGLGFSAVLHGVSLAMAHDVLHPGPRCSTGPHNKSR